MALRPHLAEGLPIRRCRPAAPNDGQDIEPNGRLQAICRQGTEPLGSAAGLAVRGRGDASDPSSWNSVWALASGSAL